jgi:outer membrane protein insertion porin family
MKCIRAPYLNPQNKALQLGHQTIDGKELLDIETKISVASRQTIPYFASMQSSRIRLLVCICLLVLPAYAQKFAPMTITFAGYADATQSDLLAASGLKASALVGAADLQAATQKLDDTGLFRHITYKYDGQTLSFQLEPAPGLVPANFDNFAWMDAAAIDRELHAKLPLYKGKVIAGSGLEKQMIDALTAMAADQHLAASVAVLPIMNGSQLLAEQFRLASPPVAISQLIFQGASPDQQATLAAVAKEAVGEDYSLSVTPDELTTAIETVYHNQGYLDAKVTAIGNDAPVIAPDKVSVPMKATIVEGGQYRLGKLTLDGSVLMSQEEFSKRALLKPGDIANQELLRRTLQIPGAPYRTKGYLRAKIGATPTLDPTTHVVDYAIHVQPGDQFHMGKVELANLSDPQRAKFLSVWKMQPGDPYDVSYPSSFLVKNAASLHDLDGYSASYKQYEHEDTHIVDLVVSFKRTGPVQ